METSSKLLKLIKEVDACLGGLWAPPDGQTLNNYFREASKEVECLASLEQRWINCPSGGGRTGEGYARTAIWGFLGEGKTPEEVARIVEDGIRENSFRALEVHAVSSAVITSRIELTPDVYLIPYSELPKNIYFPGMFEEPRGPMRLPIPTDPSKAALVFEDESSPAVTSFDERREDPTPDRYDFLRRLTVAIGLASGGVVKIKSRTTVYHDDSFFKFIDPWFAGDTGSRVSYDDVSLSFGMVEGIKFVLDRLQVMPGADSVMLAAERLLAARTPKSIEDRIIDLAMAAEILLTHGLDDERGEIAYRLAIRAARLLGGDIDQRIATKRDLKDLYSARSGTVHNGYTEKKFRKRWRNWDKLVAALIWNILDRGDFPVWERLELGDEGLLRGSRVTPAGATHPKT